MRTDPEDYNRGHRRRLKQKFMNSGMEPLHEYEALELLLTYVIRRQDVKRRAKALLEKFDSVKGIFDAEIDDLKKIEAVLEGRFRSEDRCHRMVLDNREENRKLSFEIYSDVPIGKRRGNLISVYTAAAHLQLHFCSGYVVSEMLGEVTFVSRQEGKLSGLIIEKGAACSLFANVDADLLSGDFTQLGPEVMLSGVALSLTENLLAKASR